ncbi:MAG: endolytic transglycosylase MltG, partial [Nitrospirae bacterium]|nr:endolytic transglycosylase MltG [Nitrospirota bacterium]
MKRNIIFAIAGIILSCWIYVVVELMVPVPGVSKKIELEIPKGSTFRQAIEILSKEKLIRDKNLFLFIGRVSGLDRKIRAGYYSIYESMSPLDIFKMLKKGQIIEYEFTIVEGDSLREIAEKLSEKGIMSRNDFMLLSSDEDFLASYTIDATTFEG